MKKLTALIFCAALLFLTACGASDPKTTEKQPPADGNYAAWVFDTSADAGKLTARYLALKEDYGTGSDAVTTGDSSVYTSPDGKVMLVDCGNQNGGAEITAQLKAMGVEKIDILVMSHPHADHIGGFGTIADNFPIGQIYMNGSTYDSETYRRTMQTVADKNIPYTVLWEGDTFAFGNDVEVSIYGPARDAIEQIGAGYMDENNCSIAMRLTYGSSSFWTSGDIYATGESALAEKYGSSIRSDVVKMNHHGWDTSNSAAFVETMKPLIAVGMHDSITSKTVALRYSTRNVLTFYNCMDGAVRVSTPGDGTYDVQSQRIRDVTFYGAPNSDGCYRVQCTD